MSTTSPEPDPDGEESRRVLQGTDLARKRDYLNALLDESVANGDQQVRQLPCVLYHEVWNYAHLGQVLGSYFMIEIFHGRYIPDK